MEKTKTLPNKASLGAKIFRSKIFVNYGITIITSTFMLAVLGALVYFIIATAVLIQKVDNTTVSPQQLQVPQVSKKTMRTLVGEYGKLKIKELKSYEEACETGEPTHSYSYDVENGGVKGLLSPRQCGEEYDNNALEYKFIDTHGSEKCIGKVIISLTEKETEVETRWEIQNDASSDTNCSTKGGTYTVRAIDSTHQR